MGARATRYSALLLLAAAAWAQGPDSSVIKPGQAWFDTDGNRIYAGGANIYEENGVYYWVGEGNKVLSDCSACFNLYSSTDLASWRFEGCVLNNSDIVAPIQPPQGYYRMERPKIFKCPASGEYVLWFHCDTPDFKMTSVGVLTSTAVTGPYKFASPCFMPDGQPSYDMGLFVDSTGDGHAYLVRSVRNAYAGISQLRSDCLNTTGSITSAGPDMEGQALMRDASGTLHLMGSHLTGWGPNPAQFVTSPNATLVNATWVDNYNPTGDPTTYDSQSTFILPYTHSDGHVTYMYMGDRWNEAGPGGLQNATYIWLPLLPPNASAAGGGNVSAQLQLATCDANDALQRFTVMANGSVLHPATGLCVEATPGQGATLQLQQCARGATQSWTWDASTHTLSAAAGSGGSCVDFNVANNALAVGNPIISWACGSPPAWNEQWDAPPVGQPGQLVAFDDSHAPSSLCATIQPTVPQWSIPWLNEWSLKDY